MKVYFHLSAYQTRMTCIERGWYTHGDNEAYGKMLDKCDDDLAIDEVVEIAEDIIAHSDPEVMEQVRQMYETKHLRTAVTDILLFRSYPQCSDDDEEE